VILAQHAVWPSLESREEKKCAMWQILEIHELYFALKELPVESVLTTSPQPRVRLSASSNP